MAPNDKMIQILDAEYMGTILYKYFASEIHTPIISIGGNRCGKSVFTQIILDELIEKPPAISPADEKKLKNLVRMYNLAKVKRDKVRMTDLEKQITAIRIVRLMG